MTAEWELAFQKIDTNEMNSKAFQKEMATYAKSITEELLQTIASVNSSEVVCSKYRKQQLLIRDKIVKCPDEACNWIQFRIVCGVQIGITDIERLVENGRTSLIKGMKSKVGKAFDACFLLNDKAESSIEFEKRERNNLHKQH